MQAILIAILLGALEGVTEFLPISSTGHLLIAEKLVDFHDPNNVFTVVVQLGAIAAVVWYFRKDIWAKISGLFNGDKTAIRFWILLVIATLPAGLAGLVLESNMDSYDSAGIIGTSLVLGGVVLWLVERCVKHTEAKHARLDILTARQSGTVGFAQALSLIPGVSRSGATITGGLLAGLDRPTATAFSFYLGIPIMVLASGLKLMKHGSGLGDISGGIPALIVGTVCAFVTALIAVSWLLRYVARHNFKSFAYYRIIIGVIILLFIR